MIVTAIVAHPDDEIIGIGGTLYKHIRNGDVVFVYFVCDGRKRNNLAYLRNKENVEAISIRESVEALRCIGIDREHIDFFKLKNGGLDSVELLTILNLLHYKVAPVNPDIIYTHYYDDLNIDHQIVSKAVITQFRALPGTSVKEILFFETLSSTEQARHMSKAFCPNLFVDITEELEFKLKALERYKSELRSYPHPRNIECIKYNAILNGAKIGINAAETFMVSRILR